MAREWIKMRIGLEEEPEVVALAAQLKCAEVTIVGALHKVWSLADQHTTDGFLSGYTTEILDRKVQIEGFGELLSVVGWLAIQENGLQIPRFEVHNGQSAKQRAQSARRMNSLRSRCAGSATKKEQERNQKKKENKNKENKQKKDRISYPSDFNRWYAAFPRHEAKRQALKAWPRAVESAKSSERRGSDETVLDFLIRRARDYAADVSDREPRHVKLPATWLNSDGWEDEYAAQQSRVATAEDLENWSPH